MSDPFHPLTVKERAELAGRPIVYPGFPHLLDSNIVWWFLAPTFCVARNTITQQLSFFCQTDEESALSFLLSLPGTARRFASVFAPMAGRMAAAFEAAGWQW